MGEDIPFIQHSVYGTHITHPHTKAMGRAVLIHSFSNV